MEKKEEIREGKVDKEDVVNRGWELVFVEC